MKDRDTIVYPERPGGKGEYVMSPGTGLELKREEPAYAPDGKIALVLYPNKLMDDYMASCDNGYLKHPEASVYMEAYIELDAKKKEVLDTITLLANDADGNSYEKELRLSDSSRTNAMAMVREQVSRAGFKDMESLWADYARYQKEITKESEPVRKTEHTSLKPRQESSRAGLER